MVAKKTAKTPRTRKTGVGLESVMATKVSVRKNQKKLDAWSTNAESEFIRTLGTHSEPGARMIRDEGREALLRAYRQSVKIRVLWDAIDQRAVMKAVQHMSAEVF